MPFNQKLLYQFDSAHDHYEVVERDYEGRPARVLFSGSRQAAQSGIGLDDDQDLLFDYNQRILELANNLYPKRILMIGGGAYTLTTALLTALPDVNIEVVELDPALQTIAEQYFGLQTDDRLQLHFGDGRQFLIDTKQTYDLIIVDVFTELAIPRQFLTLEFVEQLYVRVNSGGCIAMNIIATLQGHRTAMIKSQTAAYRRVFDRFDVFPAGYGLTRWLPQNLVLTAQRGPVQDLTHFVRYAAVELPAASADDIRHDNDQ